MIPIGDRLALRDLVDAYALAVDRRDGPAFRGLWTPDARLTTHAGDGPPEGDFTGPDDIARVVTLIQRYALTFHLVANHVVRAGPGPTATGEAYCIGHHLTPTDDGRHDDYVMGIRYVDGYARDQAGEWRFTHREVRRQWTRHETVDGHPSPGAS